MAVPNLKKAIGNSASTTLSSSVSDSATSADITSDTNFNAASGEGQVIIGEGTANEELAYSTSKTGSALNIPLANRGLEGGAAAGHSAGETVKGILSAGMWNDLVDTILEEHNDAGTHKNITIPGTSAGPGSIILGEDSDNGSSTVKIQAPAALAGNVVLTLPDTDGDADQVLKTNGGGVLSWTTPATALTKAAGSDVTTGTDDAKYVTSKALADADINTRLKSKIITATRDMTAANGNVAYTGVGFVPTSIHAIFGIDSSVYGGQGFVDSARTSGNLRHDSSSNVAINTDLICTSSAAGGFQEAVVASYDADGFTLTWTKTSTPTGTMKITFICYR